eukprot:sb/3462121/
MSLSSRELSKVLQIVTAESSLSNNLDAIALSFHKDINRSEHFKVGMVLMTLLQNRDLLEQPAERIAALYLLFEMYRSESFTVNPFAPFFHSLLTTEESTIADNLSAEVYFISLITSPSARDIYKMSPRQIVRTAHECKTRPDTRHLKSVGGNKVSGHVASGISVILPDIEEEAQGNTGEVIDNLVSGSDPPSLSSLKPAIMRPTPPLHRDLDEELIWINPNSAEYTFEWEPLVVQTTTVELEIRKLITKALKGALPQPQQNFIREEIGKNPRLIYHIGLTPGKFPALVENNCKIALEVLLHLSQSNQLTEYFTVLVNMELSVHSMEVMNELLGRVVLPPEYIHLYITKCILHCEECKDRLVQHRFVRLVCVFLSSLIRHNTVDVKDMFVEVQAFCINFSRIKEAAGLFSWYVCKDHLALFFHAPVSSLQLSTMSFNTGSFVGKLIELNNSTQSIQTLCGWAIHHKRHAQEVVDVWFQQLTKSPKERKLLFLYLANDIVQNCKRKNIDEFKKEFSRVLPDALSHTYKSALEDLKTVKAIDRILAIWQQRDVFSKEFITKLQSYRPKGLRAGESESGEGGTSPNNKRVRTSSDSGGPDAETVIRLLVNLERGSALQDTKMKQQLQNLPPEVWNVASVDKISDRKRLEGLLKSIDTTYEQISNHRIRLQVLVIMEVSCLVRPSFPAFEQNKTEYTERTKVANLLKEFVSHQKQQLKHVESKILLSSARRTFNPSMRPSLPTDLPADSSAGRSVGREGVTRHLTSIHHPPCRRSSLPTGRQRGPSAERMPTRLIPSRVQIVRALFRVSQCAKTGLLFTQPTPKN